MSPSHTADEQQLGDAGIAAPADEGRRRLLVAATSGGLVIGA